MEEKKEENAHHHPVVHHKPIHEHYSFHPAHKKNNIENVLLIAAAVLALILIINIFLTFGINKKLKESIETAKEAAKPAKIELVLIRDSKCADCFDASVFSSYIKSLKVELLNEKTLEFSSGEARSLINKYKIQKIPSIIVTGELNKLSIEGFNKVQDGLVLAQLNPPYTDALSGRIVGKVSLKLIKDDSCMKCNDMSRLLTQIKFAGIKVVEEKNISLISDEGKSLIQKYNLDFVPTVILSEDAEAYPIMQQAWPTIGTKEEEGYVLRMVSPPFINLTTGKLSGLVDLIYLVDKSCADCYNVSFHKSVLTSEQSFAIIIDNEETVDIGDAKGKGLIAKYNITKVPTVVLSDEVSAYPSSEGLRQFFSIEQDGYYVFRQPQVIGAYMDLATNTLVKPQENQGQQA
ncbi:hypothetical protein HY637_03125 [Candidatus Woesearchaeota archaeon]|nr:hypothetical protein [Candidatus Woesearchaeota archaeon]